MLVKMLCLCFGHKYRIHSVLNEGARKLVCARCAEKFAMHDATKSVIPWDSELEELYKEGGVLNPTKENPARSPDSNVEKNREMLLQRSIVGLAKYGVTTDNNPLSLREWLQHALEEALDMANYLQAAISKLDAERNEHGNNDKGA